MTVRIAEVGAGEVGQREVGAAQVGGDQVCAPQVGAAEVHGAQVGPDEVRPSPIERRARGGGAREPARAPQQGVDRLPVGRHVERLQRCSVATGEAVGLVAGRSKLGMERTRRRELECLGQVPEQLVELAHDRKGVNSPGAMSGSAHQPAPATTACETRCPAPKQS